MKESHIYGVARVHIKEEQLLNRHEMEQLLTSDYDDAVRILQEKGYRGNGDQVEEMLMARRSELWNFLHEISADDALFSVFRHETDYHNLKAVIKTRILSESVEDLLIDGGNIPIDMLQNCVKDNDFTTLPPVMANAAAEALDVLLRTQDGQRCDLILDRGALEQIAADGQTAELPLLRDWAEWKVATTDIKIAVRCCLTEKSLETIRFALVPCNTLDIDALSLAANKEMDALYDYLENTSYHAALPALQRSMAAFEKWCDDVMMERLKVEKADAFTVGPVLAYMLAVESEIKQVRLILTAKRNHLEEELIKERMRELYG